MPFVPLKYSLKGFFFLILYFVLVNVHAHVKAYILYGGDFLNDEIIELCLHCDNKMDGLYKSNSLVLNFLSFSLLPETKFSYDSTLM